MRTTFFGCVPYVSPEGGSTTNKSAQELTRRDTNKYPSLIMPRQRGSNPGSSDLNSDALPLSYAPPPLLLFIPYRVCILAYPIATQFILARSLRRGSCKTWTRSVRPARREDLTQLLLSHAHSVARICASNFELRSHLRRH